MDLNISSLKIKDYVVTPAKVEFKELLLSEPEKEVLELRCGESRLFNIGFYAEMGSEEHEFMLSGFNRHFADGQYQLFTVEGDLVEISNCHSLSIINHDSLVCFSMQTSKLRIY